MASDGLFMSTVLLSGFLSFFAPCTFPLIPVYIGILSNQNSEKKVISLGFLKINVMSMVKTFLFVAGLSTSFILLGYGAGALGRYMSGRVFGLVSGFIVVVLGMHQAGFLRIRFLEKYKTLKIKKTKSHEFLNTYLLGLGFSFGWTPCVGPVLGAVLVISAGSTAAFYGAFLMMFYAIGLAIPFFVLALMSDTLLSKFENMEKHLVKIKVFGGVLIILMGLLLMADQLNVIAGWIENLL